jgi:APA family basic amino acid/polyamine antiporter
MADDGVLPAALGRRGASGAPVRATLLQSAWVSVLVLSGTFESLVLYAGVVLIVFSALAVAAVPVLRRTRPELARPYRARPWPLAPLLYLAVSAALMWAALQVQLEEAFWGLVTVAAGVPVYYLLRRRRTAAGT